MFADYCFLGTVSKMFGIIGSRLYNRLRFRSVNLQIVVYSGSLLNRHGPNYRPYSR